MGDLVEHAGLGEREGAAEEPLLQQADLAGVEAVEAPHHVHPGRGSDLGHGSLRRSSLSEMTAFVNYIDA